MDSYDNENVYIDILTGAKDRRETKFCSCLNGWLEISNTSNTVLPVLITDILEQIAFNGELDLIKVKDINKSSHPILGHLTSAVTIAKQGICSISTLVSIAYIRKFLKTFLQILESVRFECSEIPVLSQNVNAVLCQDEKDKLRKKRLEDAFKHFSSDCNKLFTKFKVLLKEKGIDDEVTTTMMHIKVKMPVCTILDEQSVMFKILKVLVGEQNSFIQAASSFSKQHSSFIRDISVVDVRKSHLINFKWDDYWLDFSQCDTDMDLE
ncbi:unnamed protein product [Mytilus edulis]|uniref:Uncharacterized protein n=1 Tax=Mytilus edulis TaxID=6550 RepID=A0A8S3U5J1_MYTED|nr:unnamed protein product [Mytilus edulis]